MAIKTNLPESNIRLFFEKIEMIPFHTCWEWVGAISDQGYGVYGFKKYTDKAHRISYILHKGPIEPGKFILHSCDNRSCVNPDHLRQGTAKDNTKDAIERKRIKYPPKMGGYNKTILPIEIINMFGKKPDTDLAREIGVHKCVIARARRSLKIPPFPCQTKFKEGDPHPRWGRNGGK